MTVPARRPISICAHSECETKRQKMKPIRMLPGRANENNRQRSREIRKPGFWVGLDMKSRGPHLPIPEGPDDLVSPPSEQGVEPLFVRVIADALIQLFARLHGIDHGSLRAITAECRVHILRRLVGCTKGG